MKTIKQISEEFLNKVKSSTPYISLNGYYDYYCNLSGRIENEYYSVYFTKRGLYDEIEISHTTENPLMIAKLIKEIEPKANVTYYQTETIQKEIMKKLDNIVVESLDREHGEEIIKTFRDLGVNTRNKQGFCCKLDGDMARYYGVIKGEFSNFTFGYLPEFGAKLITLEQLKAMKEYKSEFPKIMWVWGKDKEKAEQKEVICRDKDGGYWAKDYYETMVAYYYRNAQDIEEAPDPKREEKTKVEFTGSLCMGDFQENTMTFEIEGDMTLQSGRYLISKID